MNFSEHPIPRETNDDEPGVMRIGGGSARKWWGMTLWLLAYLGVAALLVVVFVQFGSTLGWAMGLVIFMLAYMTLMGRWAAGSGERQ